MIYEGAYKADIELSKSQTNNNSCKFFIAKDTKHTTDYVVTELFKELCEKNNSELETVAGDSIGKTIEYILNWFDLDILDIKVEDALRERDW